MRSTKVKFHSMNRFPDYSSDDNTMSETVLIYDETGDYCDLGYYDFESSEWCILGDFSFKLACWCYVPNPKDWFSITKGLKTVEHRGYC